MTMRSLAVLLFSCMALSGETPEWWAEHRTYDNPFYLSPWPANAREGARITREQVVDFISHIGIRHFTDGSRDLDKFQFASLAEGKMHLVAVIESGGTIGANLILITHCEAAQCVDDYLRSSLPIELTDLLVSVRNDGVMQLLTRDRFLETDGIDIVERYELYELAPSGPEDVTRKYQGFVRKRLAAQGAEALSIAENEREREYVLAAADYALARFDDEMGVTKNSLLEHAMKWAQSDSQHIKALAVRAVQTTSQSELRQQLVKELEKSSEGKRLLDGLRSPEAEK